MPLDDPSSKASSAQISSTAVPEPVGSAASLWTAQLPARHSLVPVMRLPVELLTDCFRASDFETRVRASHVSRSWRAVALGDPTLWTRFSCNEFRDKDHEDTALEQLTVMLQRSRPLPFFLSVPNYPDSEERMLCAIQPDLGRLSHYTGSLSLFNRLNPDELPLPMLTVFGFSHRWMEDDISMTPQWSSQCIPNLNRLDGRDFPFLECSSPFLRLQHLACSLSDKRNADHLFRCCPNIVTLQLRSVNEATTLPPAPFPRSLKSIALVCDEDERSTNFGLPLRAWRGVHIPLLFLYGENHFGDTIPLLLSSHDRPVELTITGDPGDMVINTNSDADDKCVWRIACSYDWRASLFVTNLKTHYASRLEVLSISLDHLPWFLVARVNAPIVFQLELLLTCVGTTPLNTLTDYMHLPGLRYLVFCFFGTAEEVLASSEYIQRILAMLRNDFRSLIRYDAALLDSITLCGQASCSELIDFSGFACFAQEYTIETDLHD